MPLTSSISIAPTSATTVPAAPAAAPAAQQPQPPQVSLSAPPPQPFPQIYPSPSAPVPYIPPSQQQQRGGVPPPPIPRPLRVEDALAYLDQVKQKFNDKPLIYNKFLNIMRDFKNNVYVCEHA